MKEINHEAYCGQDLIALLLKAGFDWQDYFVTHHINEHFHWEIPLHIAQRWLREEKLYDVLVDTGGYKNYEYFIDYHGVKEGPNYPFHEYNHNLICNTYEEALEAGIKKALEMILLE